MSLFRLMNFVLEHGEQYPDFDSAMNAKTSGCCIVTHVFAHGQGIAYTGSWAEYEAWRRAAEYEMGKILGVYLVTEEDWDFFLSAKILLRKHLRGATLLEIAVHNLLRASLCPPENTQTQRKVSWMLTLSEAYRQIVVAPMRTTLDQIEPPSGKILGTFQGPVEEVRTVLRLQREESRKKDPHSLKRVLASFYGFDISDDGGSLAISAESAGTHL